MISRVYACEQLTIIYFPFNSEENLPRKKKILHLIKSLTSFFITTENKLPI